MCYYLSSPVVSIFIGGWIDSLIGIVKVNAAGDLRLQYIVKWVRNACCLRNIARIVCLKCFLLIQVLNSFT